MWRADWDRREFAVKIFRSTLYMSWGREGEIYKTCMLTHPHILQFITMEKNDTGESCDSHVPVISCLGEKGNRVFLGECFPSDGINLLTQYFLNEL